MMASHLSLGAIRFFSASVFCYKAASALYLLIIAVLAIHRGEKRSRPIFYALRQPQPAPLYGIAFCRFMSRLSVVGLWNGAAFS